MGKGENKPVLTKRDFEGILYGSLTLNEICEAKDVWIDKYFEVLPGAFEPRIYLGEKNGELSVLVEYEERKEYLAEPRTPDNLPDDFKKWLVDEVGEEKAQELREHYDLLGGYIRDYCDEKGISWERFTYPDAVAQEGAYVDLMREDYGFEGGRTHGPFPEHAHYEWSKEVTVDKEELQRLIGSSLESFVEWIAERIIPPTPP